MVRSWLSACDYGSTEYVKYNPGRKNLADEKRIDEEGKANNELLKDVRIAMARIYNRAKESVSTNYLWIVEDDVIPPLDVCEKMFRSFCPQTVSVSAPFRHRYEQAFVAWDSSFKLLTGGEGVQTIGGNGFGCVLLRSKVFCKTVFTCSNEFPDFDQAFYAKLDNTQLAKINWDLECQHLSPFFERPVENETRPITPLNEEEFDFEYYLQRNPDVYRAVREGRFVDAYQHYSLHGWEENRPARALERKDAEKSEPNLRRLGPKVLTL